MLNLYTYARGGGDKEKNKSPPISNKKNYFVIVAKEGYKNLLICRCSRMYPPKSYTVYGKHILINFVGTLLWLAILVDSLSRCHCDIYSFHTNPLLVGSVSMQCSPKTYRSTLEAAAGCNNASTCLAIASKCHGGNQSMACACPADGRALNKNGTFYFRDAILFKKGK